LNPDIISMAGDRLSPAARSAHMRLIRKRDTTPERVVRRIAHALGYRFRLHRRDLPGSPDLAFPRHRKVVLVHGCFWHQHEGCRLKRQPKSRLDYWLPKLARNVARDREVQEQLFRLGWAVLVIWECETRDAVLTSKRLSEFLR
jgi:DNA mismatch endonuclease (patch repair protein)